MRLFYEKTNKYKTYFSILTAAMLVLSFAACSNTENADVSITCPKNALFYLVTNDQENMKKIIQIDGNEEQVILLAENMTQISVSAPAVFNIIEP